MASKAKPKTIERRIYFYRLDGGSSDDGAPVKVDLESALGEINTLPFSDDSKRYWAQRGGDAISLWTQEGETDRFSLAAVRRANLPRSEINGNLADLQLSSNAGLHEPIHVRMFGDNILGVESNFYGPRISRLAPYLKHALGRNAPNFSPEALLRQDSADRLGHIEELRVVELYLRPSYISKVSQASKSLGDAFRAMDEVSRAAVIGLTLRPEPNQRAALGSKILKGLKKVASRSDVPDNVYRFKAKGVNDAGRIDQIDLLEDHLVSKKTILTVGARSRAVLADSAYEAIGEAYEELRDELLVAAGLGTAT